jgi:hypothetical protein
MQGGHKEHTEGTQSGYKSASNSSLSTFRERYIGNFQVPSYVRLAG